MLDDLKFIHEKDANDTLGTAGNQWKQVLQDYSLNIEKAKNKLNWHPKWDNDLAIEKTILWYKDYYNNNNINTLNDLQLFNKSSNFE